MEKVDVSSTTTDCMKTDDADGEHQADFDVSDILANYFSKRFKGGTSGGGSPRDDRRTLKKKKKKKDKKKSKRRSRSSSEESNLRERGTRSSSDRKSRYHRRRSDRTSTSHQRLRAEQRDRSRSSERIHRRRSTSGSSHDRKGFNKSELFEVARRNVKSMLVSGTLPKGFVIDPEKMGFHKEEMADSIERYTAMCRKIRVEDENEPSSYQLNHPFLVKDSPIIMNIANAISIPTKTSKEKILSAQFPVSSGCSHRELEWQPVETEPPKKKTKRSPENAADFEPIITKDSESCAQSETGEVLDSSEQEIRSLSVPQLLANIQEAARRLESNPFDIQAQQTHKHCGAVMKEMNIVLPDPRSIAGHLHSGPSCMYVNDSRPQAWARRNQLRDTKALNSGIGMTLLQKMGWTPGTALGKNQEGALEPLMPQVKFDRKGLSAQEDNFKKPPPAATLSTANRSAPETTALQKVIDSAFGGKHPVTLILEICAAKKLTQPVFADLPPIGEPHDRTFLCRVDFNGKVFIPKQRSLTKKLAKAQATLLALADIGAYCPPEHK